LQRRPVLESRDRMRYTPRREATEPRSGECLQWGLFGHVDFELVSLDTGGCFTLWKETRSRSLLSFSI